MWAVPECKGTRLYEHLSDETVAGLRPSLVQNRTWHPRMLTRRIRGAWPTEQFAEFFRVDPRSSRLLAVAPDQAKLGANWPVCMMPLRSNITLRSCGLVAVFMASSRSIVPLDNRVTRDWSNVSIP